MGRRACCTKEAGLNRGAWTSHEDKLLSDFIAAHGQGRWRTLPKKAGLKRCGKSCRLRWLNYLRPDIKRGNITNEEEDLIVRLHKLLGNRWSLIAGRLPGRTDNEIKNYWNTYLRKKLSGDSSGQQRRRMKNKKLVPGRPLKEKVVGSEVNVVRTKAIRCSGHVFPNPTTSFSDAILPLIDNNYDSRPPYNGHERLLPLNAAKDTLCRAEITRKCDFPSMHAAFDDENYKINLGDNEGDIPPLSDENCTGRVNLGRGIGGDCTLSSFLDGDIWDSFML